MEKLTHDGMVRARNEFYHYIRHNEYTQAEIVQLFEKTFQINREDFNNAFISFNGENPRSIMEGSKY